VWSFIARSIAHAGQISLYAFDAMKSQLADGASSQPEVPNNGHPHSELHEDQAQAQGQKRLAAQSNLKIDQSLL
jgi:hypothetical protein